MSLDKPESSPGPESPDLPPENTTRWIARRKAQVVQAVKDGALDIEEACRRYRLTHEELISWERLVDKHGLDGLRTTRLKLYR